MAEKVPQTKANHVRLDALYHFITLPALLLLLIWAIVNLVREPGSVTAMLLVLVIVVTIMNLNLRSYPLKAQDRVIRLEERLRLATWLPDSLRGRIGELTERQLIALRFASDAELTPLVERVLNEKLTPKQIKDAIREWRPDYWRV
ncbi:MAG TPA: DUF6526 family protein [Bryobacteraceae bacterium]|jgi:hypothetical protein|nr:DUF6526 family protein [Bryobacteraceae bacterium]